MPWDFQEAVYLDSGEPEHFAELWFGDASSPEFFQGKCFEGAARQVPCPGDAVDQFIRDLKDDIHGITLTRPSNRVKQIAQRPALRLPFTLSFGRDLHRQSHEQMRREKSQQRSPAPDRATNPNADSCFTNCGVDAALESLSNRARLSLVRNWLLNARKRRATNELHGQDHSQNTGTSTR